MSSTLQPIRYENGLPMLFSGLRRYQSYTDATKTIPIQWQDFNELRAIVPHQCNSTVTYGIICGHDTNKFEYMCGIEVSSFDNLPPEIDRITTGIQRYAVFLHSGAISEINNTWQNIMMEWLPHSSYNSAHKPDFERYDERYNGNTGTGEVEIWLSVNHRTD